MTKWPDTLIDAVLNAGDANNSNTRDLDASDAEAILNALHSSGAFTKLPRKICDTSGCLNTAPEFSAHCDDHRKPTPAPSEVAAEVAMPDVVQQIIREHLTHEAMQAASGRSFPPDRDKIGALVRYIRRHILRTAPVQATPPKREWLVIVSSQHNAVFADEAARTQKGYIPRDVAEQLLGRDLGGQDWFSREDSEKMRSHPEWTTVLPATVGTGVTGGTGAALDRVTRAICESHNPGQVCKAPACNCVAMPANARAANAAMPGGTGAEHGLYDGPEVQRDTPYKGMKPRELRDAVAKADAPVISSVTLTEEECIEHNRRQFQKDINPAHKGTGAELAQGMVSEDAFTECLFNVDASLASLDSECGRYGDYYNALVASGVIVAVPTRHEVKAILDDFETNDGRADALLAFITGRVAK